jgi:hypothetical protein
MKTDDLIDLLATGAGPSPRAVAARRLAPSAGLGLSASVAGALLVLGPIPAELFATAGPWLKLAYAGALGAAAAWLSARLGRPLAPTTGPLRLLALVVAAMALLGGLALLAAPADQRMATLLGHSWSRCPFYVLALSLPALAAALWALRGLAPTQARAAGLAGGLLAGGLGAFGYALACTELSPAFIAVWYSLGIGMAGALGAVLGPLTLRW